MRPDPFRPFQAATVAAAMLLATVDGGCISSMKYGAVTSIQPASDSPRVGNVYLVRGLIGLFSAGIDRLSVEINQDGIRALVFQEVQDKAIADAIVARYADAKTREPLCLVGHSVGAEDVITIARTLEKHGLTVDLMITMDPTNPGTVPPNVKRCVNYYQSSIMDNLPILRGVPLKPDAGFPGEMLNLDVRNGHRDLLEWDTNHVNIDKNSKIHADIIRRLNEVCPPRPEWLAMHVDPGPHATGTP